VLSGRRSVLVAWRRMRRRPGTSLAPPAAVAVAVAVALVAACARAPTCPARAPVAPGTAAPWLWRVQRADGTGPVLWLYGTVHDAGAAEVAPAAWDALRRAPRFVSELGELEPDPDQLRALARLPRGKGLDQLLGDDHWWDLRDTLRDVIREDDLRRARPWYAMSLLIRVVAPSPRPAMDAALAERARALHLPIDHLETWEEQLPQLDAAVGVPDLIEAIDARATMRCELDGNRAAYAAGDTAAVERIFGHDPSGHLLRPRNQRWLIHLERYLADSGAFVAVGVGHLVGDDGLPAMLARAGYTVARQGP